MRLLIAFALLALTACAGRDVKPTIPPAPQLVEVPVKTFVPIPDDLLTRCTWRKTAPLEVMPAVARERKRCLELYEADREAIRRIRGQPVPGSTGNNGD